jgi:hypothetical protein
MDPSAVLDPTHLVTFLVGTAVGAAGKYYADKFTDQRKKKEQRAAATESFRKVLAAMPELLNEMKDDLTREKDKYIRELVVLPNERVIFNSDRDRFIYYENKHPGLHGKLVTLADAGYLVDVQYGSAPVYRFTEAFVDRLMSHDA